MHKLDIALTQSFPLMPMPRYGAFERLAENGQRLLVAENGFFLEVRRDWLYAVQRCGHHSPFLRLPFGTAEPVAELAFGTVPKRLVAAFIEMARFVAPNELAGVMVYDRVKGSLDLRVCESKDVSPTRVTYRLPQLGANESVAVDIHSHGDSSAGFSSTDDQDDQAATKIAVVVGKVRELQPDVAARLCLQGVFIPLTYQETANCGDGKTGQIVAVTDSITKDIYGKRKYF